MKHVLMVVVSCVWGVGCTFGVRTCETPADCEAGAVCRDNLCVLPDRLDGGGGGAGGGVGGGGGASGCSPACAEWQSCTPSGCANARVTAVSPASGAVFSGGETVRFVFRALDWDGGVWPFPSIPARTSGGPTGPSTLSKVGTTFEADFTLANTTGPQAVHAGWPAAEASIQVMARTCNADCAPWQGCVADSDGGSCEDLGLSLSWVTPAAGERFGPRNFAAVPLLLSATRADGGAFSADIPYWVDGGASGAISKAGDFWQGTVDAGPASGGRALWAGWVGGPQATRGFEVVLSAPSVQLVAEPPPMRPAQDTDSDLVPRWKKSETALVRLESNRPLLASSVVFTVPGVAPVAAASCSSCAAAACLCFGVDLKQQTLLTGVGSVAVGVASGEDTLGNPIAPGVSLVNVPVTRLKWVREVTMGAAVPMGIALAPDGTAVVGGSVGSTSLLRAFGPDGGTSWTNSYANEGMTAAPLIGARGVYFGVSNPSGPTASIRRVAASDGSSPTALCFGALSLWGDMALVSPGISEVVVAMRSDGVFAPSTASCIPAVISSAPGTPSLANWPSLVATGTDAFLGLSARAPIWKFSGADTVPVAAGNKSTTTLFPANLFVVGANLVGGGGGPTVGGAFAFLSSGTLSGTTVNATPGTDPGGPAIVGASPDGGATVFYGDSSGNVHRVGLSPSIPSFGTAAVVNLSPTASFADRAPLLGRDGHLYLVGSDGTLRVHDATTLVEEWRWPSAFPTAAISHLNLDIDRDAPSPCASGQPGVLYLAASTGAVMRLYAVLVDSAGLDSTAPWPRHQHNPSSTANRATSLASWTCP